MRKRLFFVVGGVVLVVATLAFVKYQQIHSAMQGGGYTPPPEAVTTVVAAEDSWQGSQSAIGTAIAVHGVTVSADLPGIVQEIAFKSGGTAKAGEVLVRLDTSQEQAQLTAAEAKRELARLNLERAVDLKAKEVISQADFDRTSAEAKSADAAVVEAQALIRRKTIRAPFTGMLGIRQVNLGQYLAGGDPVVPLQSLDPIYVNFGVPQQSAGTLHAGDVVQAFVEGVDGVAAEGKITAVNSIVDEATRNVEVQATFANRKGTLRPGMFVEVQTILNEKTTVVALPTSAINYAPYGNSVFIVEDVKGPNGATYRGVRQQFVKLGASRGDQVAVLSGVKPGEEVVSSGVFKLRPGAAVEVHNDVQPSNNPSPKPEDS